MIMAIKSIFEMPPKLRVRAETALVILFITATVFVLLLSFSSLTKYPIVFIDEPWYANVSWNWVETGEYIDTLHASAFESIDFHGFGGGDLGLFGVVIWGYAFKMLGLGLYQARLVSWVFGVLVLFLTYIAGFLTYRKMTGGLAMLLLALSPPFLQASHYARPDIMLVTVAVFSYILAIIALTKSVWWMHVLSGFMMSLAVNFHQNAILFMLGLFALYVAYYRNLILKKSGTWLFALGGLLGLVIYSGINILPNPVEFFAYYSLSLSNTHTLPLLTFNPVEILRSARDEIGRYHFYDNNLDFALIGASVIYLLYRRKESDRLLISFIGTIFIGFVLFVGNKHDIYAILLYPFFMIMVSETFMSLLSDAKGFNKQSVFTGMLLLLLLFNSGLHYTRPITQNNEYDYDAIVAKIRNVIPTGNRIMGLPHWWLGMADYDYQSSLNLTYYHLLMDYSLDVSLDSIRPDFIIVDSGLRGLLVDDGYYKTGAGFEIYNLPRKEFLDFLELRGEKLLEFSNAWHGKFEIYSIDWSDK